MKALKIVLAAALFLFLFHGCIEISTLVTVNKDGSGTLEETVMLSSEIIEMITELEKSFAEDTTDHQPFQFYNEEELKAQTSQFGEEVRYVSSQKISRERKEGYVVMYEFRDLNELRINQNPNSRVHLESFDEEPSVEEEFITFSYIKGQPNELRIQMPMEEMIGDTTEKEEKDSAFIEQEKDTTMMNDQLAAIFKDLKISLMVGVEGNIVRTNAEHVADSKITLLEIDFSKLLEDPEKLAEFRDADPQNLEEVKEIIKGIPGIKVDLNKMVTVQFE
jgi:hypothetical protein